MKMTLTTITTLLFSFLAIGYAHAEEHPAKKFERAYFLDTGKGQTDAALKIYREIAALEVNDSNRKIVRKTLTRMLEIYDGGRAEQPSLEDYVKTLNLDFEAGPRSKNHPAPSRWGGGGEGYEILLDSDVKHGGTHACRIKQNGKGVFASVTSSLSPERVRGKTLRLSGMIKLEGVSNFSGLWMRSDVGDRAAATFYNMQDQKINGTKDWQPYSFELDIPTDATNINFGALLAGKGTVWIDDLNIEEVKSK